MSPCDTGVGRLQGQEGAVPVLRFPNPHDGPTINTQTGPLEEKRRAKLKPSIVLTIGHSTHTIEEFIRLLQAHAVTRVADVRTLPRSKYNPQFNRDTLRASLKNAGIG